MGYTGTREIPDQLVRAAQRLREIRGERGLSRAAVVARLAALDPPVDRTENWLGHIEKAQAIFPLDLAPALARALRCTVADLLGSDHWYPAYVPTYPYGCEDDPDYAASLPPAALVAGRYRPLPPAPVPPPSTPTRTTTAKRPRFDWRTVSPPPWPDLPGRAPES